MTGRNFYKFHLEQVSRSFAFCIARLEEPFRTYVSNSYLICRILDTIEDSAWASLADQQAAYDLFEDALLNKKVAVQLGDWSTQFPLTIPNGERQLLRKAPLVFSDFHGFPESVRQAILAPVQTMLNGMQYFSGQQLRGEFQITNMQQLNRYCYFVAGVVGDLLTGLLHQVHGKTLPLPDMSVDSLHFGLFLQKINLLKDQQSDQKEGRYFIHNRLEVVQSLSAHAKGVLNYLESIPIECRGYRIFCAWSAFLGLASLPWIEKSYHSGEPVKISRLETKILLVMVESLIDHPGSLRDFYMSLARKSGFDWDGEWNLPPETPTKGVCDDPSNINSDWFDSLYSGGLDPVTRTQVGL